MSTIQDLERKVQSLEDELKSARESLTKAKLEVCYIKQGDIVSSNGDKWRVRSVGVSGWNPEDDQTKTWNRPQIYGNKQKKDGTWGSVEFHIYRDWERVQP